MVNLSSIMEKNGDMVMDDFMAEKSYSPWLQYGRSKVRTRSSSGSGSTSRSRSRFKSRRGSGSRSGTRSILNISSSYF